MRRHFDDALRPLDDSRRALSREAEEVVSGMIAAHDIIAASRSNDLDTSQAPGGSCGGRIARIHGSACSRDHGGLRRDEALGTGG